MTLSAITGIGDLKEPFKRHMTNSQNLWAMRVVLDIFKSHNCLDKACNDYRDQGTQVSQKDLQRYIRENLILALVHQGIRLWLNQDIIHSKAKNNQAIMEKYRIGPTSFNRLWQQQVMRQNTFLRIDLTVVTIRILSEIVLILCDFRM